MKEQVTFLMLSVVLLGLGVTPGVVLAAKVFDQSLVGHYEFEGDDNDSPSVFMGDARIVEDTERGRVLSLDGDGDYVDCGSEPVFNFKKEITVACWVKFETPHLGGDQTVISKVEHNWTLERERGNVDFYCNDIRPTESIAGNTPVSDRQWHHFAGTYDGSQICIYLDGIVQACARSSGPISTHRKDPVWIGAATGEEDVVHRTWRGFVDDVAIFSRALSADEISRLCSQGLPLFVAGPTLQDFVNTIQETETIVRKRNPQEAVAFLEKEIAEHKRWKEENPNHLVLCYKRMSADLYYLLAKTREVAGASKEEVAEAYKRAIESDRFSSLSMPRQGPALLWLYENTSKEEYEGIVRPVIENDADYLTIVMEKGKTMVRDGKAQAAIGFLEANLAAYTNWQAQHRYYDTLAEDGLPAIFFWLAKAKEAAGSPSPDIADAFCRVFSPSRLSYGPARTAALVWLFENESANEYTRAIKSFTQTRDAKGSLADVVRNVCQHFESEKDWVRYERFLSTLLAQAKYPFDWLIVVESSLSDKTNQWAKKYSDYLDSRPALRLGKDCVVAERYAAEGKHKEAAALYDNILKRCGPKDDKTVIECRLCKCLFSAGKYREAGAKLESFLAKHKAITKSLRKDALLMKSRAYLWLGEFDKAADGFFVLVMEYPEAKDLPDVAFSLGRCYVLLGNFEAAMNAYDCVVRNSPSSTYASEAQRLIKRIQNMTQ